MCCKQSRNTPTKRRIDQVDDTSEELPKRQRQKNTSSRSVSFAIETSTQDFLRHDEHCKSDIWYSKEDAQLFQLERILSVQCLQRVTAGDETPLDPEIVCFRGLEPYSSEKRRQKFLLARQTHVAAVLEEQSRQRSESVVDEESYRKIVQDKSQMALQLARIQAICDEHEARPDTAVHNVHWAPPKHDFTYEVPCPLEQEATKHFAVRAA